MKHKTLRKKRCKNIRLFNKPKPVQTNTTKYNLINTKRNKHTNKLTHQTFSFTLAHKENN